jgi:hypothetical protein
VVDHKCVTAKHISETGLAGAKAEVIFLSIAPSKLVGVEKANLLDRFPADAHTEAHGSGQFRESDMAFATGKFGDAHPNARGVPGCRIGFAELRDGNDFTIV